MVTLSHKFNVVIANGATISAALQLPATFFPAGLIVPTLTTSTVIRFSVSDDGVTYYPLYDGAGALYGITVDPAVAEAIALDPSKFYAWEYIKLYVADAQTGDKTIGIIVRNY